VDKAAAKQTIKQAIIRAIQKSGKRGFLLSQSNTPVVTGELKRSGSVKELPNGVEIDYTADYASDVERGTRPGNRHVRAHFRAGHPVKEYDYYSKGQKANPFIETGLHEAFAGLKNDMDTSLREEFAGEKAIIRRS
jgi:hypothetical protein